MHQASFKYSERDCLFNLQVTVELSLTGLNKKNDLMTNKKIILRSLAN